MISYHYIMTDILIVINDNGIVDRENKADYKKSRLWNRERQVMKQREYIKSGNRECKADSEIGEGRQLKRQREIDRER